MKAKGSEIMAFYKEWPLTEGDWYVDDGYEADDEGNLGLDPSKEYDVEEVLGYIIWQGRGECPPSVEVNGTTIRIPIEDGWTGPATVDVFKAWRGDVRAYSVMLKPEDVAKFQALCAENGWVVL